VFVVFVLLAVVVLFSAGSNLNNLLGQAGNLGSQQFGQSFANLGFGSSAQGQLANQSLNLGQAQGQLGLGQQGLDLQNQGQRNEFGLTQQQIANQLVQTLLTGSREGGFPTGALLGGLLNNSGSIFDIFKDLIPGLGNPNSGEPGGDSPNGSDFPPAPGGTGTGGDVSGIPSGPGPLRDILLNLPPAVWDILFPGGNIPNLGPRSPNTASFNRTQAGDDAQNSQFNNTIDFLRGLL